MDIMLLCRGPNSHYAVSVEDPPSAFNGEWNLYIGHSYTAEN